MDTYRNPVQVYLGEGCVSQLPGYMEGLSLKNNTVLVLAWGEEVFQNEDIKAVLKSGKYRWILHCFTVSNPDLEDLYRLYENITREPVGLVIGIGGGSILDMAKSLCCLQGEKISTKGQLREKILRKDFSAPDCPWIGIPTTAGTGSEVTCWATVWDREKNSKLSLENQQNYACAAFVDPQFARSMPLGLTVASALDAASHALEAYWAKASNTVSKALALEAISTIMGHMDGLFEADTRYEAQNAMAKGSLLAGLAFSNTKTTAGHSLSYPITLKYNIPHGVAVSLLLAPVMEKNQREIKDIKAIYKAFGCGSILEIEQKIHWFLQKAQIPVSLQEWGAKEGELSELAENGSTTGRIDNNPAALTQEDIYQIMSHIYEKGRKK